MSNILITGGAGFIGSYFIKYLLKKYPDYKIFNLDKLNYAGNIKNLDEVKKNPNYIFVEGDICDINLTREIIAEVDIIVNFAAQTHVDNSINNAKEFIKTNIEGTYNLLERSREFKIERFLQISTDEVYGSIDEGCFLETSALNPNNPYSASKASADMLVRAYYKTYNLPVLITRSSNNYGPYQHCEKLIPFFISKLLNNEKVPLYGDGSNIRDWLFVGDNCRAIDMVLHKGIIGEIYNIGANNEKTNLEITEMILKILNKNNSLILFTKDRLGHDKRYALSTDKIKNELNWSIETDFEKGLKETVEWYLNNQNRLKK